MFGFLKKSLQGILKRVEKPKEKKVKEVQKERPKKLKKEKIHPKTPVEIKKKIDSKKKGFFTKRLSEKDLEKFKFELIKANVSFDVAQEIADKLKDTEGGNIKKILENELLTLLEQEEFDFVSFLKEKVKEKRQATVLFFGFNGAGKTTTIARIGYLLKSKKIPVVFAAADTFRAAAIEQISKHAENLGIEVIKHKYGGDPAAVVFDAKRHAEKINGVVLADTAGRLHSDKNLMLELSKIIRVNNPDFKVLVLDSLTGNDILEQIEKFGEVGFDALVLTKVDVNEKGGAILSIKQKTKKPILFLGFGQDYKDLEEFDSDKVVKKLLY